MPSGIYQIRNSITGDCYIGSSVDIDRRLKAHIYQLENNRHHSRHLQSAWNKYGDKYFECTVLDFVGKNALRRREQDFLDLFKPRYNIHIDANNAKGTKRSAKTKKKLSEHHNRLWAKQYYRDAQRTKHQKWASTDDGRRHLARMWQLNKSDSAIQKWRESMLAKIASGEFSKTVSEAMREKWSEPDFKAKMTEIRRKQFTPEVKAKMSATKRSLANRSEISRKGAIAFWANPDNRTRRSELVKAQWRDPKFRQRMIDCRRAASERKKRPT